MSCSTLSIPYRYDLGTSGDSNIPYFIDNGFRQSFGGVQNSSPCDHESFGPSLTKEGKREWEVAKTEQWWWITARRGGSE
jgi:hypothetical protein